MNLTQRISSYFILSLLLCISFASHSEPGLWKIEKNGVNSYLFGTVHVGDASMKGLPGKVTKAIDASDKVIVEVDISAISPMEIQRRSLPFMMLKNGKTLQSELSEQNYAKLKEYFSKKSIDIAMFNNLAPWAVMVTMMQMEFQNVGFSDQTGIDKQVLAYAKEKKIAVGELETLEYQMEMFNHLSLLSNEMIEETFEQLADVETYFITLVDAWKNGDMATLTKYYNESFDDSNYGEISEQVMLIERNNNWVKELTPRIGKEKLFIAVGALHLPEQHGLLKQFNEQGFTVTRL
ncbi:TraB/GumN family protein [Pseudoalteromonas sp. KG3]|uniref:TraB/GumN family protein n=1 Tax=Pseudoalteromonas prydzensis TaxID=182141 RepID=A0ABR9FKJ9_9GAMM|nr:MULTISPECIES: TraB/GumN family protein [Pseudoalteromonas]MBE0457362.1 TraB/GumN family protein [Pseudoalteromonas prydzensis]WKD22734.1 TraB/GumN family protein [Pseudoalteromonas sp. KG3]